MGVRVLVPISRAGAGINETWAMRLGIACVRARAITGMVTVGRELSTREVWRWG